jgi:calcineurin-like phosphoesterase family protein
MNYYIISDTHFGHKKLFKDCDRPVDFDCIIYKRFEEIKKDDVLIHLGDICFDDDIFWHEKLSEFKFKKWLMMGNHDKKSKTWYLSHGWDFVADFFSFEFFGKNIVFSHKPMDINKITYDINIHGHFHNFAESRHEPELRAIKNDKQFLIALENNNYLLYSLKHIVKGFQ